MILKPDYNCLLCPRLVDFRNDLRDKHPDWFNGPVPAFGPENAQLLIVGLAPGMQGANKTGRPFTGDYAGDLLYSTLSTYGFSEGCFDARIDDGLKLVNCRITNAVKCLPPENKPIGEEVKMCQRYLIPEFELPNVKVILVLGRVAHEATVKALSLKQKDFPFSHGGTHALPNGKYLIDSYHCSRYNTNTGRLTEQMFHDVFDKIRQLISC